MGLKYAFHKLEGFPSVKAKDWFVETMLKGEKIINSDKMKEAILTCTYPKRNVLGKLVRVKGMYGLDTELADFYETIMCGSEKSNNDGKDFEIDLLVRVKAMPPGVLGSMTPGNPYYNISSSFFDRCYKNGNGHDSFGNNYHEFGHHLGQYHKTKIKSRRQWDPAYSMGRIGRGLFFDEYKGDVKVHGIAGPTLSTDDSTWMNQACL